MATKQLLVEKLSSCDWFSGEDDGLLRSILVDKAEADLALGLAGIDIRSDDAQVKGFLMGLLGKYKVAAAAAAGRIPTAEVLRRRLPSLPWGNIDSKSTAGGLYYYVPSAVLPLEHGPLSGDPWTQEVIRTIQATDAHDHWAFPLPDVIPNTVISQAGIAGSMYAPLQLLTTALNKASALQQRPQTQGWVAETSTSLLQKAAAGYIGTHPDLSEFQTPASASHGSSKGSAIRQDVLLITGGQHLAQQSQQQQQQVEQQQQQHQQHNKQQQLASSQSKLWSGTPVAVGEYNKPTALATQVDGTFDPRDLKESKDPYVQHAVCQVYTYLLLLQLQYAFLSCYYWTWVVHLSKDRRTLYISDPIAHDTISNQDSPKVTTLGAIYWVQHCGLQTFDDTDFDDIDLDSLRRVKDLREVLPVSQEPASQPDNSDNDPPYDPKVEAARTAGVTVGAVVVAVAAAGALRPKVGAVRAVEAAAGPVAAAAGLVAARCPRGTMSLQELLMAIPGRSLVGSSARDAQDLSCMAPSRVSLLCTSFLVRTQRELQLGPMKLAYIVLLKPVRVSTCPSSWDVAIC